MKVVYPKNIQRWLLAWLTFSIGPLTISVIQMFILAVGVALALASFNGIAKSWSKALWLLVAVVIILVFLVVAFFKMSELWLLAYIAKLVRNNFFDANKKFQVNYPKHNPIDVAVAQAKTKEEKRVIEQKDTAFDPTMVSDIEKKWLL